MTRRGSRSKSVLTVILIVSLGHLARSQSVLLELHACIRARKKRFKQLPPEDTAMEQSIQERICRLSPVLALELDP